MLRKGVTRNVILRHTSGRGQGMLTPEDKGAQVALNGAAKRDPVM